MGNEASTARPPSQGKPQKGGSPASLHMRVVISGDRKTGKSSLFNLLQKKRFAEAYTPTRGSQKALVESEFYIGGIPVRLEVHDVSEDAKGKSEGLKLAAPQQKQAAKKKEDFYEDGGDAEPEPSALQRERATQVYKGAHAAVLMLDPHKRWTFQWVQREVACLPGHVPALVIANFRDVAPGRESVAVAEVRRWCASKGEGVRFCEASMLNRFGVKAIRSFLKWPFFLMEKQYLLARLKALEALTKEASEQFEAGSREQDYDFYKEWLERTLKERMEQAQGKQPSPAGQVAPPSAGRKGTTSTAVNPKRPPAQKPQESGGFFSKIKSIVSGDAKPAQPPATKKKPVDPRKAIEEMKKVASEASRGKVVEVDIDNFDPSAVDGDDGYDDFFGSDEEEAAPPATTKLEKSAAEEEEANPWVQEDADIDEDDFIVAQNRKTAESAKGFYSDSDDSEGEAPPPAPVKTAKRETKKEPKREVKRKAPVGEESDEEEEVANPMVAGFADIDSEDEEGVNPLVAADKDFSDEEESPNPFVAADEDISDEEDTPNPLVAPDEDLSEDEEGPNPFVAADEDVSEDEEGPNPLVAAAEDISSDGEDGNPLVAADEDISSDDDGGNPFVAADEDIDSDDDGSANPLVAAPADDFSDDNEEEEEEERVVGRRGGGQKKARQVPASASMPDASAFSGFAPAGGATDGFAAVGGGSSGGFFGAANDASSSSSSSFFGSSDSDSSKKGRASRSSGDVRRKGSTGERRERRDGSKQRHGREKREGRERRERDPAKRRKRPPREEVDAAKKPDPSVYML